MPMPRSQPFSHRIPVRFTHTDPAGFVFFPRFFEMFQAVLEDWFTYALGVRFADLIQQRRLGTPVATIQSTFAAPCRLGEELDIAVGLEHVGSSSFRLVYRGAVGGSPRLEAVATMVMISLEDGRPRPIPADVRQAMQEYGALSDSALLSARH